MTGSTECDSKKLAEAKAEENYYIKRYKQALDGVSNLVGVTKPSSVDDVIHGADLNVEQDKARLIDSMKKREEEVAKCVNDLIAYQELDFAAVNAARGTANALKVAEGQRQDALRAYNNMLSERDSKARIVEINTYYSKEYNAYTNIFKTIFAFCIPLVILGMLNKEEILDDASYFRFSLLIIIIALLMTAYRINDMYWRNNINYDNYEWLYNTAPVKDEDKYKRSLAGNTGVELSGKSSTCSGASCCDDTTFWDGKKCNSIVHDFNGIFYYCVNDTRNSVKFIPTSTLTGKVVGTGLNGTFTVNTPDNTTCTMNIVKDKTYTITIAESGAFKKITFSSGSGSNVSDKAPKHNSVEAGTKWLGGTNKVPSCSDIANA